VESFCDRSIFNESNLTMSYTSPETEEEINLLSLMNLIANKKKDVDSL